MGSQFLEARKQENLAQGVPVVMITTEGNETFRHAGHCCGCTRLYLQAVHGGAGEGARASTAEGGVDDLLIDR